MDENEAQARLRQLREAEGDGEQQRQQQQHAEQVHIHPAAQEGHEQVEVAAIENENREWSCRFCTYINSPDTNICDVCSKTIDFDPDAVPEVNICPNCTLMNAQGTNACEACGFNFDQVGLPINPRNLDINDHDEDSEEE